MVVQGRIEKLLKDAFQPSFLQVENESYMHRVPEGAETHFKVVLVSEQFANVSPVKRHQQVYRVMAQELQNSVHALALHTFTQSEWEIRAGKVTASPACRG